LGGFDVGMYSSIPVFKLRGGSFIVAVEGKGIFKHLLHLLEKNL